MLIRLLNIALCFFQHIVAPEFPETAILAIKAENGVGLQNIKNQGMDHKVIFMKNGNSCSVESIPYKRGHLFTEA